MIKTTIIDGYVDEPACLGVPPYISPYPRYIAGAIWDIDKKNQIFYCTIDQIRSQKNIIDTIQKSDVIIVIAGMSVPGRYLSGHPASPNEIKKIIKQIPKPTWVLCGPAAKHGFGLQGGQKTQDIHEQFQLTCKGDDEIVIKNLYENNLKTQKTDPYKKRQTPEDIKKIAVKGAEIIKQHPFYPDYLISEIETYRGCPRAINKGCSFCSEPLKGLPQFRQIKDIVNEIKTLNQKGEKHIRLGNQPCIYSYMAKNIGREEFPTPNPQALEKLLNAIRQNTKNIQTLHIDNANPGVIAKHPKESEKITKTIIKYHTPGDVAAFGVESTDPAVIKQNNLKGTSEDILKAIKILNKHGKKRGNNGLPELLPGLNFVFGLPAETRKTYQYNLEFLQKILKQGLLIRRINLRQVIPIPNTQIANIGTKIIQKNKKYFKIFKRQIKEQIEKPLLKKLLPKNTTLKQVYTEKHHGKLTFARQIGTYPILVGIPGRLPLKQFINVKIIDHGYRSVTALPYPLNINHAQKQTLQAIPQIGQRRANRILLNRPLKNQKQLIQILDDQKIAKKITQYIKF